MNVHKGWAFPRGIYSEVHSPITTPEIICVMALTLQPIRGCPQHSGETGTRLSSAIHWRLLSRFFLREGRRLYTGYYTDFCRFRLYKYQTLSLISVIALYMAGMMEFSSSHFQERHHSNSIKWKPFDLVHTCQVKRMFTTRHCSGKKGNVSLYVWSKKEKNYEFFVSEHVVIPRYYFLYNTRRKQ